MHLIAGLARAYTVDEIVQDFPSLSPKQIEAAIEYAKAYPKSGRPFATQSLKRALGELADLGAFEEMEGPGDSVTANNPVTVHLLDEERLEGAGPKGNTELSVLESNDIHFGVNNSKLGINIVYPRTIMRLSAERSSNNKGLGFASNIEKVYVIVKGNRRSLLECFNCSSKPHLISSALQKRFRSRMVEMSSTIGCHSGRRVGALVRG